MKITRKLIETLIAAISTGTDTVVIRADGDECHNLCDYHPPKKIHYFDRDNNFHLPPLPDSGCEFVQAFRPTPFVVFHKSLSHRRQVLVLAHWGIGPDDIRQLRTAVEEQMAEAL